MGAYLLMLLKLLPRIVKTRVYGLLTGIMFALTLAAVFNESWQKALSNTTLDISSWTGLIPVTLFVIATMFFAAYEEHKQNKDERMNADPQMLRIIEKQSERDNSFASTAEYSVQALDERDKELSSVKDELHQCERENDRLKRQLEDKHQTQEDE